MSTDGKQLHVAMFPWLAFGHLIPFLELSKLIAQKGHKISFISTPRNIDRLPKIPPNLESNLHYIKLPLVRVKNLPENAEATSDLPYNKVPLLKKAYDLLQEPVKKFLDTSTPDWIIHDFVPYWLPSITSDLSIKNGFFSIFMAAAMCVIQPTSSSMNHIEDDRSKPEDFTVAPKWVPFPTTVSYRLFEITKVFDFVTEYESSVTDIYRFQEACRRSDIIAIRSCVEFEPEWLQLLEKLHGKPVVPVGLLPPETNNIDDETDTWRSIKGWLDKQEKSSVVYVGFGSEAKPCQEEVTEIALGLELSQLPFFWVLSTQRGSTDTESIELPPGFEERVKGCGIVWTSWAPQVKILSHDSVGGLLTHSGWSSVIEALQLGRALIVLTFLADQGLNASVLREKKIGYLIPRNERHGSFTRNSVAESLRLVMVQEEGGFYRDKAKEMKGLFGDRNRQEQYVDSFLGYLETHKG